MCSIASNLDYLLCVFTDKYSFKHVKGILLRVTIDMPIVLQTSLLMLLINFNGRIQQTSLKIFIDHRVTLQPVVLYDCLLPHTDAQLLIRHSIKIAQMFLLISNTCCTRKKTNVWLREKHTNLCVCLS